MLTVNAHDADVNVISWNRLATYMLASGGDDGTLRIWDLRNFKVRVKVKVKVKTEKRAAPTVQRRSLFLSSSAY
jgi:WD40 repeat protein